MLEMRAPPLRGADHAQVQHELGDAWSSVQQEKRRRQFLHALNWSHLDVEPQDVVLGQAEPADGRFIIDAGVRPMPVVAVQPDRELGFSLT